MTCDNNCGRDYVNFIAGSILGAAIGAGIALLFAPQSGRQTRTLLHREGKKIMKEAGNAIHEIESERITPQINRVRKEIDSKVKIARNEVDKAIKDVKKKVGK